MNSPRSRGRPCRGQAEVGREKILEALRQLLRSRQCFDLSRKSVAASAGVTPALISYYYPRKEQLLEDAVAPVIWKYCEEIKSITASQMSRHQKRAGVIKVLMRMYRCDGRLFDVYRDFVERRRGGSDHIANIMSAFAELFASPELQEDQLDAVIVYGAIWGMCRFAAQVEQELKSEEHAEKLDQLREQLAESMILRIFSAPLTPQIATMVRH